MYDLLRDSSKIAFIILLSLFTVSLLSEENAENREELTSIREDRLATLRWGIDKEIIELLDTMRSEQYTVLNSELLDIFDTSRNPSVRSKILDFFSHQELDDLVEACIPILEDYDLYNNTFIKDVIRYTQRYQSPEISDAYWFIFDYDDDLFGSEIIRAIGYSERISDRERLAEIFETGRFDQKLKESMIRALGDLRAVEAEEELIRILDDDREERGLRWVACEALGKIGTDDAFEAIQRAYFADDANLRTYVMTALQHFPIDKTWELLVDGLRDSFWRVRVQAAKSLAENKVEKAVDILIYKARQDPERPVRTEAFMALAAIGTKAAYDFLRDYAVNTRNAIEHRLQAIEYIIEHDLQASRDVIEELINKNWDDQRNRIVENIAKHLSRQTAPWLEPLFGKMLDHDTVVIKIYAIRGIGRNGFTAFRERLEELDNDKTGRTVRKEIVSILEEW